MGLKRLFVITGCLVAFFILAMVILLFLVDADAYKPLVEAVVSDALGMDCRIGGKMNIALLPLGLSAKDVHIRNLEKDVLSADGVKIGLRIAPLIRREIRISEFEVIKPRLFIERDRSGKFNFGRPAEKPPKDKGLPVELLSMTRLTVAGGEMSYTDVISGSSTELKDLNLRIADLSLKQSRRADLLKSVSLQGDFGSKLLRTRNLVMRDLKFGMSVKDGVIDIRPFTMSFFGGDEKGRIEIDTRGAVPLFKIEYTASKFRFEKFVEALSRKKIMKGETNFSLKITTEGKSLEEMKRRMKGEASLRGENLLLYSMDLDHLLSKFEESQQISLVDLGAFFLAGPLGTAVTKGYDFASVYGAQSGGEGTIKKLVSKWRIRNGVAEAEDVALTTEKNRIALKGGLDFPNKRFDNVTVAVLDRRGCSKLSQKIEGPFRKPRVEKTSTAETLAGPVLKLLKKAKKLVEGERCEPFYRGSLKHPA